MPTSTTVASQATVSESNRSRILQHLYYHGICSRAQIAKALGLTPAAITKITARLIEAGIIEEFVGHGIGTKMHERLGITDYTKDTISGMFKRELARNGYLVDQKKWWRSANKSAPIMDWLSHRMQRAG